MDAMSKFMGVAMTPSEDVVCCCGKLVVEFDDDTLLENDDNDDDDDDDDRCDVKDCIVVDLLDNGMFFEMVKEKT